MSGYEGAVEQLVAEHKDEIRTLLGSLRGRWEGLDAELAAVNRRICMLEGLLDLPTAANPAPVLTETGIRRTLHQAMADVLRAAPERMMRAGDLATAIDRRGLYKMRDGRPVEAQQIHARVGHYPTMFVKEGGLIKLR